MDSCVRPFVHPDDASVFAAYDDKHTFNLDFPPPAFIGDVDSAPIVVLMAHGGFDPKVTPNEFPEEADRIEYLQWLKGERTEAPRNLSAYYTQDTLFQWIQDRKAVIVNAVAYRSPKLAQEPHNLKVARLLPSVKAHRHWLQTEVLDEASSGRRRVVAHHWRFWNISPRDKLPGNVDFSRNPISKTLACDLIAKLDAWLSCSRR